VSRALNGQYDGIMMYLDTIGYPKAQRELYKKFFWNCKPYLLHQYYLQCLPQLSPKLEGGLALFHYGEHLRSVPFFSCEGDDDLLVRFQALVAAKLTMQAFCQNEDVLVDSLYLIIEGLIGCNGRVKRKGMSIGHEQVLDGRAEPGSACSLTFSVCMALQSEDLWDVLRTRQFDSIKHKVRIAHAFLALRTLLRRIVMQHKNQSPSDWRKEEMKKYKDFLLRCCREKKTRKQAATPLTPKDKCPDYDADIERETKRIAGADLDAIRDQRTMLRLVLSKIVELGLRLSPDVPNTTDTIPPISSLALSLDGESSSGCFDGVNAPAAASTAPPPAPALIASPAVTMQQIWKRLDGLCADVFATKTEMVATLQSTGIRLGRIEHSLEAVCATLPPASNLSKVENTESGANHQQTSGTGTRTPHRSPNRIRRRVPSGPPLDLDFEKAPITAGVETRLARMEDTLLRMCTAMQVQCLPVVDLQSADV
jgi:hypothetical protein